MLIKEWLQRFTAAESALEALQASCSHSQRSFFSKAHCERCALQIDATPEYEAA